MALIEDLETDALLVLVVIQISTIGGELIVSLPNPFPTNVASTNVIALGLLRTLSLPEMIHLIFEASIPRIIHIMPSQPDHPHSISPCARLMESNMIYSLPYAATRQNPGVVGCRAMQLSGTRFRVRRC